MQRFHSVLRTSMCALALMPVSAAIATTFAISPNTNSGNPATYKWFVSIDGGTATNDPTLTVLTGQTYNFNVSNVAFHPFWIDQSPGIGGTNPYPVGDFLSANHVTSNTSIQLNLPADAPDTLYYACGQHSSMIGTITVVHDLVFRQTFD